MFCPVKKQDNEEGDQMNSDGQGGAEPMKEVDGKEASGPKSEFGLWMYAPVHPRRKRTNNEGNQLNPRFS